MNYFRCLLWGTLVLLGGCNLDVSIQGNGSVVLQTNDGSAQTCEQAKCSLPYNKSVQVEPVAHPGPGYVFSHWEGSCSGTAGCLIAMGPTSGHKSLVAIFEPLDALHAGCAVDDTSANWGEGLFPMEGVRDIEPLCSGWVYVAEAKSNTVQLLNVLTQEISTTYQLSAAPDDIQLDAARKLLFASHAPATFISRINLTSGDVTTLQLGQSIQDLAGDNNGLIFALGNSNVFTLDADTLTVSAQSPAFGSYITYDNNFSRLIAGKNAWFLNHDTGEFSNRHTVVTGGDGANCNDASVSPDGEHIVLACGGGNGDSYSIFDYSGSNPGFVYGEFETGAYPEVSAFSPDGKLFFSGNYGEWLLFDTATHRVVERHPFTYSNNYLKGKFSRGGLITYLHESGLGTSGLPGIAWRILDNRTADAPKINARLSASKVFPTQYVTLTWNVSVPDGVTVLSIGLSPTGESMALSGSTVLPTPSNVSYEIVVNAIRNDGARYRIVEPVQVEVVGSIRYQCDSDTLNTTKTSGSASANHISYFVPLCDGWLLVADKTENRLRELNAVHGRNGRWFQLSAAPKKISLDDSQKYAYVQFDVAHKFQRVNLASGEVETFTTGGPVRSLLPLPDGMVLVSSSAGLQFGHESTLNNLISSNVVLQFSHMVYDGVNDHILAQLGNSVRRYSYNLALNALTEINNLQLGGANCRDFTLSPDGKHVALPCGGGNGYGYSIYDYDAYSSGVVWGEWVTGAYPRAAVFTPQSDLMVSSSQEDNILVFDVQTHALVKTISTKTCTYGSRMLAGVSLGGTLAFASSNCGFDYDSSLVSWGRINSEM